MAFKAEQVNVAPAQQPRIGRAVRRVASYAALCFFRRMLKGEGASFVGVTVETKLVLGSRGAQLVCQKPAMRIVAIAAADQAFIYFVMERLGKIWLHIEMAGVAKLRLRNLQ